MGVVEGDIDSNYLLEKGQTTTPNNKPQCSLITSIRQTIHEYRENREEKYRSLIEEIRGLITKDHIEVKRWNPRSWAGSTSTKQRRALWEEAQNSSTVNHGGYTFSKSHKYKITIKSRNTGSKTSLIQDFRTPEGREQAFMWWNERHQGENKTHAALLAGYDKWEKTYQNYIHEYRSAQRWFLIVEAPKTMWADFRVEALTK
ncbi:hypothetical protein N8I77_004518 [Diaporthe amygdali]|uniref:Uncharacterized protein n=1 Tax=Phomopsis amygdali TaxID=1214568 RepID=A0AAD9SL20_PHOAM|nr:hypothetical protein N8I77_004518 [Diaporthe amygdali]